MENYINRIEICFFNTANTKDIDKKEKLLNKILFLVKNNIFTIDLMNYIYKHNPKEFINFIELCNLQVLLLFTYDFDTIARLINLNDNKVIVYNGVKFLLINKNDNVNNIDESPLSLSPLIGDNINWGDY